MPKQLAEAQTKLENVERQFETAKMEVNKPFAKEAKFTEKLERLLVLNALLNMDEKSDDAIGMDGTADIQTPNPAESAGRESAPETSRPQGQKMTAEIADKPVQKASLKEKLEAFKRKAAGMERSDIGKAKGRRKCCRHINFKKYCLRTIQGGIFLCEKEKIENICLLFVCF